MAFLLAELGRGKLTPGEAEKLARLVSEYHKAVQLTEMEERFRRVDEELGLVPWPWISRLRLALAVSASEP